MLRSSTRRLTGVWAVALVAVLAPASGHATSIEAVAQLPDANSDLLGVFGAGSDTRIITSTRRNEHREVAVTQVGSGVTTPLFTASWSPSAKGSSKFLVASPNGKFIAGVKTSCGKRTPTNVTLWRAEPGAQPVALEVPPEWRTRPPGTVRVSSDGRVTMFVGIGRTASVPCASGFTHKIAVLSAAPGASTFRVVAVGEIPGSRQDGYESLHAALSADGNTVALCRWTSSTSAQIAVINATDGLRVRTAKARAYTRENQFGVSFGPGCLVGDGSGVMHTTVNVNARGDQTRTQTVVVGPRSTHKFFERIANPGPARINACGDVAVSPDGGMLVSVCPKALELRSLRSRRVRRIALPDGAHGPLRSLGHPEDIPGPYSVVWSAGSNRAVFPGSLGGYPATFYVVLHVKARRWSRPLKRYGQGDQNTPCFLPSGRVMLRPRFEARTYISDAQALRWSQLTNSADLLTVTPPEGYWYSRATTSNFAECAESDGRVWFIKGSQLYAADAETLDSSSLSIG